MYRQAIEARKGRYPRALYSLGVALRDSGRPLEAKEAYRQAISTSGGKHAPAHYMLGLLVMAEGDDEAAAALCRYRHLSLRDCYGLPGNDLWSERWHL